MKSQLGGVCCWLCQTNTLLLKEKTLLVFYPSLEKSAEQTAQIFDATSGERGKPRVFPFISASVSVLPPLPEWRGGLSPSAIEHILLIAAAFPLITAQFG